MVCCSVVNCSNNSDKGFRLFRFPANKDRRKIWIINCRRDNWEPTNSSRLCEVHFEDTQWESHRKDGWKKLKINAIPTLFNVPNPQEKLAITRRSQYKVGWLEINGTKHNLYSGENLIGSNKSCGIVLKNQGVGNTHAVIAIDDPSLPMLYDKGSKYKTKLGKTIIQPHKIYCFPEGAELTLGDVKATYIKNPSGDEDAIDDNDVKVMPNTRLQLKKKKSLSDKTTRSGSLDVSKNRKTGKLGLKILAKILEPCKTDALNDEIKQVESFAKEEMEYDFTQVVAGEETCITESSIHEDDDDDDDATSAEIQCRSCGKKFSDLKKRKAHMRNVHKISASGEMMPEPSEPSKFSCALCNKEYVQKSTLQRHVNTIHRSDDDSSHIHKCSYTMCNYTTVHKHNLKRHVQQVHENVEKEEESKHLFKCSLCIGKYGTLRRLKYHERRKHKIGENVKGIKRQCPLCDYASCERSRNAIHQHFENDHSIALKWETQTFDSIAEFNSWKCKIEKNTKTRYRKTFQSKKLMGYHCHRSGIYLKKGVGKRHLKLVGTCKINGFCPSCIKVHTEVTGFKVQYLPVHIGHKNELKHIQLSVEERKSVTILPSGKTPLEMALKKIQTAIANYESLWIDPVTIEAWVNALKISNDIVLLIYKPQGLITDAFPHLNADDFLLILMSEAQKVVLETYGHDTIYIDSTNKLNGSFQMYTLLTLDESKEGFPAVFMFTNRREECVFTIFFSVIKSITGTMTPNVFMSGLEDLFYSAWEQTMGPPKTRIFCAWHILKDWQTNINSKIKVKETRESVYKLLKPLLYELDADVFKDLLDAAMEKLRNDQSSLAFYDYFYEGYVKKGIYKCWAYSFRIKEGISTNISLDNFNRVLTHCYLRGEKVKPLDETMCAILNLLNDELFDIIIKMKDYKLVRKLDLLRRKHISSLLLDTSSVTQLEDKWHVNSSTTTELFTVKRVTVCKTCQLQCARCNSCFHEFVCSCVDSCLKNNMCMHIHLVAQTITDKESSLRETDNEEEIYLMDVDENQVSDIKEIIENISVSNVQCHLDKEKEELRQEIRKLDKYVYKMVTTPEQIDYAKRTVKQIMTTIHTMNVTADWSSEDNR